MGPAAPAAPTPVRAVLPHVVLRCPPPVSQLALGRGPGSGPQSEASRGWARPTPLGGTGAWQAGASGPLSRSLLMRAFATVSEAASAAGTSGPLAVRAPAPERGSSDSSSGSTSPAAGAADGGGSNPHSGTQDADPHGDDDEGWRSIPGRVLRDTALAVALAVVQWLLMVAANAVLDACRAVVDKRRVIHRFQQGNQGVPAPASPPEAAPPAPTPAPAPVPVPVPVPDRHAWAQAQAQAQARDLLRPQAPYTGAWPLLAAHLPQLPWFTTPFAPPPTQALVVLNGGGAPGDAAPAWDLQAATTGMVGVVFLRVGPEFSQAESGAPSLPVQLGGLFHVVEEGEAPSLAEVSQVVLEGAAACAAAYGAPPVLVVEGVEHVCARYSDGAQVLVDWAEGCARQGTLRVVLVCEGSDVKASLDVLHAAAQATHCTVVALGESGSPKVVQAAAL
jgi:hypothetical protein